MTDDSTKAADLRERVFSWIEDLTRAMRSSPDSRWQGVRERLSHEGLDPEDVIVAFVTPDDTHLEWAALVTKDGRVFSWNFEMLGEERGTHLEYQDARVTNWRIVSQEVLASRDFQRVRQFMAARDPFGRGRAK